MVRLHEGDTRVTKIIKKHKLLKSNKYRLSQWAFSVEKDDGFIVRNALTKEVYFLDPEEWDAVRHADLSSPVAEMLAEHRFLVEEDFDELSYYSLVVSILRSVGKPKPGVSTFTILPTTGCNARCVYCYQEGIAIRNMTPETAARVVDFICSVKQEGDIRIEWFGGEPLCAPKIISSICEGLTEREVPFTSGIITNGSLLTRELIREAVTLWRLKEVQISMDGAKEDYEERKRYVRPDLHNYEVVMENIRLLAEEGLKVGIRCNCDRESLPRAGRFFDDCVSRFSKYENVRVVPSLLFQDFLNPGVNLLSLSEKNDLLQYAEKLGFAQKSSLPVKLKVHQCMADSGGKSIIIDPSGGLHVCDERVMEAPLGTIFDPVLPAWPVTPSEPAEECRNCCFLPDCTLHYRWRCPTCPVNCRETVGAFLVREMNKLLENGPVAEDGLLEEGDETPCR